MKRTPNEKLVAEAYAAGESTNAIARRHGIDKSTVVGIASRAGVPIRSRLHTEEQDAEFRAWWAEGLTLEEMAKRRGVTTSAIRMRAKALGLPPRGRTIRGQDEV